MCGETWGVPEAHASCSLRREDPPSLNGPTNQTGSSRTTIAAERRSHSTIAEALEQRQRPHHVCAGLAPLCGDLSPLPPWIVNTTISQPMETMLVCSR
ncbi:hypothetical protein SKAU_G00012460 [Synaphobranchus kaupii]|uniref:Uncharacterized protein n=1 Tax=Synaphobranchus kaupii TaxID=118154 RepID=A0A9Q1GB92_SYNKA|nr:hypothetical protein SKAU_G00012460 [Synaphobranchus kaupii]